MKVVSAGDSGAIVQIQYGDFRALIAHGTSAGWAEPLHAQGSSGGFTAVSLPTSGDSEATDAADLAWLNPSIALLAVQSGNREGLPSPQVLDQLSGHTILRTDLHGWIELSTDGERVWIEVERKPAPP